jgi:hypothetical protein
MVYRQLQLFLPPFNVKGTKDWQVHGLDDRGVSGVETFKLKNT